MKIDNIADKVLGFNIGGTTNLYSRSWENKSKPEEITAHAEILNYLKLALDEKFNPSLFPKLKARIKENLDILNKNKINISEIRKLIFTKEIIRENIFKAIELTKEIAGN
jgi:hypothetical protein